MRGGARRRAQTLRAQDNGGQYLRDSSGAYPTHDGYFAERVSLEDQVGAGSLTKTGSPTLNADSVAGFSTANYLTGPVAPAAATAGPYTIAILCTVPSVTGDEYVLRRTATGGSDVRWQTTGLRWTAYDSGGNTVTNKLVNTSSFSAGERVWIFLRHGVSGSTTNSLVLMKDGNSAVSVEDANLSGRNHDSIGLDHDVGGNATGNAYSGTVHQVSAYASRLLDDELVYLAEPAAADPETTEPTATASYFSGAVVYLAIDEWVSAGDTVGTPAPYHNRGTLGAVVGLPDTTWRGGFGSCTDADYGVITLDGGPEVTTVAKASVTAANKGLIDSSDGDNRYALVNNATGNPRTILKRGGVADNTDAATTWTGSTRWVGSAADSSGGVTTRAWDSSGSHLNTGTNATGTASTHSGTHYLGRLFATGYAWSGTIFTAFGWDGSALATGDMDAVVSAREAGDSVDDIYDTYAPDLSTDGLVSGVKLAAAVPGGAFPLIYADGSGAAVTAEAA